MWELEDELSRCFPRLSSNCANSRGSRKDILYNPKGNYHYIVIPFGLNNAGATYQRMKTRMFKDKIRSTVEVHIDEMVVKSQEN